MSDPIPAAAAYAAAEEIALTVYRLVSTPELPIAQAFKQQQIQKAAAIIARHFALQRPEPMPFEKWWLTSEAAAQMDDADKAAARIGYEGASRHFARLRPEPCGALVEALADCVERSGYRLSGPTDSRAAEDGEPAWVCNARALLAEATKANR